MSVSGFTKTEAAHAEACAKRIIDSLPKSKMMQLIGEMNDLYLFLAVAKKEAGV